MKCSRGRGGHGRTLAYEPWPTGPKEMSLGSSLVQFEIIFGTVERDRNVNGYYNDDSSR